MEKNNQTQISKASNSKLKITQRVLVQKQITCIFNILQCFLSLNYAIQNALITMLMISYLTPDIIDAFVWIIPNIIAIIIRPYFIRFIHNTNLTIYNQVRWLFYLMVLTFIGNFLVAYSTSFTTKNFTLRILLCVCGWTTSGVCLDLVSYFKEQLKVNIQQKCHMKSKILIKDLKSQKKQSNFQNFDFQNAGTFFNLQLIGYTLGYLITFGIFVFSKPSGIKGFYSDSRNVFYVNSLITLLSAFAFYFVAKINLPVQDPESKKWSIPFKLSCDVNYYLPGYSQVLSTSISTLYYLFIHFSMVFMVDVITIYCTMWLAGSLQASQMKLSESYIFGIKFGVVYLLIFTLVSLTQIFDYFVNFISFQKITFFVAITGVLCWLIFNLLTFLLFIVEAGLLFRKYNKVIQQKISQQCKMFSVCKQIIQRFGKIFVLCSMPFTIMILMGRNDIQDCLLWNSLFLVLTSLILAFKVNIQLPQKTDKHNTQKQKIN